MAERPKPALIGAFILLGLALVVAAVAVWESGKLFEQEQRFVCYFPGSVNGLDVGAAVRYRGVRIGNVVDVRIRYEQAPDDTRIPVFIELYGKRIRERGVKDQSLRDLVQELIGRGLRARLESQSLVTGQLYVYLDLYPGTPIELAHRGKGHGKEIPEIPTLPTKLEEATKSLSALLEQLRSADLAGTARSLASAIEGINRLVNQPSIGKTLSEVPQTLTSLRGMTGELQATLAARGPVVVDLQRTLLEIQKAAQSVSGLAEYLQRNPNALIVGRKRP